MNHSIYSIDYDYIVDMVFVSCVFSDLFFLIRDEACHDVATSINRFNLILIDVRHHLVVGRMSRSGHASLVARYVL